MLTLGIVNTYDKIKVLDAHYRAIARAAPICHAFGFSLALFDFPFKMTPDELVEYVADKTTIGESGKFLRLLHEKKKLFVFDLPKKGFQPQLGSVVVTSSKPEERRSVMPEALASDILHNKSFLLLVGLGHKGLPKNLFEMAPYHLDITGNGTSLETCTAIGCIPAYLMGLVHAGEHKGSIQGKPN
ncbi:DUF531 domain-containing protein [Methanolobus halotolerans]|uniref:DUF531 domain-containing protein n=1 Tax=Methanolobus halotolerans TaxID=2052935 RepID=A0A4E0Q882_9EURY|nr:DUF531 domain-containing protein [Methanolobus halotolerans]TGC11100.1 DUF531 domain-containing protein [Methanolobus halotolerans]